MVQRADIELGLMLKVTFTSWSGTAEPPEVLSLEEPPDEQKADPRPALTLIDGGRAD
jgi:hypothetical protein